MQLVITLERDNPLEILGPADRERAMLFLAILFPEIARMGWELVSSQRVPGRVTLTFQAPDE